MKDESKNMICEKCGKEMHFDFLESDNDNIEIDENGECIDQYTYVCYYCDCCNLSCLIEL